MRKFLIVLAMVAMVTFLFGGCLPGPTNQAPIITSTPVKTATVEVEYTYDVNATDPDNDVLTYSLDVKPTGMIITSTTGLIKWTPTAKGDYAVVVKVSDGKLDITQSFTIAVSELEPEPELVLVGIAVDPKTMDLIVGGTDTIDSVTACYEVKGYEVDIALEDCLILTSNSKVATVKTVVGDSTTVTVTAVAEGTANIVVSYKGKIDTSKVTVKYLPMELIVDIPIFEVDVTDPSAPVGIPAAFTVEVVANSDLDKNVKFYFKLPDGYVEVTDDLGEVIIPYTYTVWIYEEEAQGYVDLTESLVSIYDPITDEYALGGADGDPLIEETRIFKGTFNEVGTYSTTVEVRTYPGDVLLCSKVITAKVIPAIPEPSPNGGS